jgi:hypothetical protein
MIKLHKEKTDMIPFVNPDGTTDSLYSIRTGDKDIIVQMIKICSKNLFGLDYDGNVWKIGKDEPTLKFVR